MKKPYHLSSAVGSLFKMNYPGFPDGSRCPILAVQVTASSALAHATAAYRHTMSQDDLPPCAIGCSATKYEQGTLSRAATIQGPLSRPSAQSQLVASPSQPLRSQNNGLVPRAVAALD